MCENFNLSIDGSIRSLSPFNSCQCFHLDYTVLLFNVYTYIFPLKSSGCNWLAHVCVFRWSHNSGSELWEKNEEKKMCVNCSKNCCQTKKYNLWDKTWKKKNNSNNNNHMHPHQNWCSLPTVRIHCCCCFFMWAFTQVGNFRRHLTLCKTQYEPPTVF